MLRNFWRNVFRQDERPSGKKRRRSSRPEPTSSHVARWVASRDLCPGIESLENRELLTILTVTSLADTIANDGQVTLREAIQAANTDTTVDGVTGSGADTIQFAPALTASAPATITLGGTELSISSDLTINGPGASKLSINADHRSGVFQVSDGAIATKKMVTIRGLTLTGGASQSSGGAIFSSEKLTVLECTISGNTAHNAGGLANSSGELSVIASVISNNTTSNGSGGGIQNYQGPLTVVQSTISGNSTNNGSGGGINSSQANGTVTITQSTISGNSTTNGSGGGATIYGRSINPGAVVISQSTISGNTASTTGGGLQVVGFSSLDITQSTVVGNTAKFNAAGIRSYDGAKTTLTNTIVAGNTLTNGTAYDFRIDGSLSLNSQNNLIGDPSHAGGLTNGATGNIVGDGSGGVLGLAAVLNTTLTNNGGPTKTLALVSGSPAINAGNNSLMTSDTFDRDGDSNTAEADPFDQRGTGFARVLGSTIDIGAFEFGTAASTQPAVTVAVSPASVAEDGSGNLIFTLTRDVTNGSLTVNFTLSGTATSGSDYSVNATNSVTFGDGVSTATVTVDPSSDTAVESDETVIATISSGTGYQVGSVSVATGTILNDDAALSIAATSATKAEGNSGVTPFTFTVTRTGDASGTASVNFAVAGSGTNAADAMDFGGTRPSGTISFAAGETTETLTINVTGDTTIESEEGFTVTLSNPAGAVLGMSSATGTILNDDALLSIAATDASKPEGNSGSTPFIFTVTRTGDTSVTASVNFAVAGNGSNPGDAADFGGSLSSGILSFAAGESTKTLTINVTGDTTIESDESFTVTLSNAVGGGLGTSTATGLIRDDEDTLVVDTLIDESDGNFSAGDLSLREAIERANAKPGTQTIVFAPSLTVGGPATITLGGTQLAIMSDLNIIGPGAGQLTVNANQRSRVLEVDDKTNTANVVSISGLTLTGANSSGAFREGGGLFNRETLTISDSVITGNVAESDGGGIYNLGTLNVVRTTISNNIAAHPGGGIASWGNGSVTVFQSTVSGNTSGAQGGGVSGSSPLNVIQSTISGNTAQSGGGISNRGVITVTQSTISGNTASYRGGGIDAYGAATVTQSTISGNHATRFGGGIRGYGPLNIGQSTIIGNTAERGGGLFKSHNTDTSLTNSIIAGNRNAIGEFSDMEGTTLVTPASHHNLIGDPRTAGGLTHGINGNIVGAAHASGGPAAIELATVLDPVLADNGGPTKTHALVSGGLAIDAGDNGSTGGATFDQRGSGFARMIGDRVDIGAVEIGSVDFSLPQVTIASSTGSVSEDTTAPMVFTFSRETTTGPLTVNFQRGGTASFEEDYSSNAPGTVTFADGESTASVTVSPIADDKVEENETVFFTILAGTGYRLGEANAAIDTILNDDRFVVDTLADESDGDFSPGDLSLREAIEQGNRLNGDKLIEFAPSLFASGPATITLGGKQLVISNDVTIQGPGADRLIIDAHQLSRVFQIDDGSSSVTQQVSMNGLTLTGANSNGTFRNGGGIFNAETLTLTDVAVHDNVSQSFGGGIFSSGVLNVVRGTISNNRGGDPGGGISNVGVANIVQSTISGNWSQDQGGGIYNSNQLTVTHSTISGNASDTGGAGIGNLATATVTQSTITGNSTSGNGGGIFSYDQFVVRQSTISGNTARSGGGIYSYGYGGFGKSTSLTNSIVVGNKKTDGTFSDIEGQTLVSPSSHNLIGSPTTAGGLTNGVNGNIVGADGGAGTRTLLDAATVLELSLANNGGPTQTLALVGGSPAVNTGDNTAIPVDSTDIDADADRVESLPLDARGNGFARIADGQVDIGAFELAVNSPPLPVVRVAAATASILEDAAGTLLFTFTRSITSGPLTANFSLTGTATLGTDYSATAINSVTFADGESSKTITIDPTSDNIVEADETIVATVISGTGYRPSVFNPASTTINNDDASLSVSTNAFTAEGNSGTTPITFTVRRNGSTTGTATVNFTVSGSGPAAADANDVGGTFGSGSIRFESTETTKTITVNVSGDRTIEPDEGLTLSLSNIVGAVLETATATVTILDDDAPSTNTYVVDTLADELDSDFHAGDFSLREAIARANAMPGTQTITFTPSLTANGSARITLGSTLPDITSEMLINGPGANLLTIDANHQSRILAVNDGQTAQRNVTISGLTFTGASGTALFNGENLSIVACRITGNTVGGGIYNNGTLTVSQSEITNNAVINSGGGGILNNGGVLTVSQSIISNNTSSNGGGGIWNIRGTMNILQSTISGNTANNGAGGGILSYYSTGTITIAQTTISGNSTANGTGGGVKLVGSSSQPGAVVISQCTISGNTTSDGTGGIEVFSFSTLSVNQNTIVGNTAGSGAGGLAIGDSSKTTLTNNVIAGNTLTDGTTSDLSGNGTLSANSRNNLIGDPRHAGGLKHGVNGNIVGDGSGGVLDINTVLTPTLANNGGLVKTHALVSGSPAINAGSNSVIPFDTNDLDSDSNVAENLPFDQRGTGFTRIVESTVDIGAVEFSSTTATVAIAPLSVTEDGASQLVFTFTRSTTVGSLTVNFNLSGTATSGVDYSTDATNSVTFADGATTATVTVDPTADLGVEADETVILTVVNGTGYQIGGASVSTGRILNDDASLSIAATSASNFEGQVGSTLFTFTVTRTGDTSGSASVDFVVTGSGNNTADAADFGGSLPSGTIPFAADETSKTITVNISGDSVVELDEEFLVTLSNAVGASLETLVATGTIRDDDRAALQVAVDADGNLVLTDDGHGQSDDVAVTFDSINNEYVISSPIAESLTTGDGTFANTVRVAASRVTRGLIANLGGGDDRLDVGTLNLPVTVRGGTGNDTVKGGSGRNVIDGGDGNDLLLGGVERDSLNGGAGDDSLLGGGQADNLLGGDGNDVVDGQGGSLDTVDGGAGDDTLKGGTGLDIIRGGDGVDTYIERQDSATGPLTITLTDTQVIGLEPRGIETLSGIERAIITGGSGNDRIDASRFSGSVTLQGGRGDDTLIGGNNDDVLHGEEGADSLEGRMGRDFLTGGDGDDKLQGGGGDDTLDAGDGNDKLLGNSGDDVMRGGTGNDYIAGHAGNDTLLGSDGNDTLLGGEGLDWLLGEAGQDIIKGELGIDRLACGGNGIAAEFGDRIVGEVSEFDELLGFNFNKRVRRP